MAPAHFEIEFRVPLRARALIAVASALCSVGRFLRWAPPIFLAASLVERASKMLQVSR